MANIANVKMEIAISAFFAISPHFDKVGICFIGLDVSVKERLERSCLITGVCVRSRVRFLKDFDSIHLKLMCGCIGCIFDSMDLSVKDALGETVILLFRCAVVVVI